MKTIDAQIDSAPPGPLYRLAMAVPYVVTAALVGILIYCHFKGEPFNVSNEDGLVEWGTFLSFLLCLLLAVAALVGQWSSLTRAQAVFLGLFAVLCFVAAGEELSWGQRIFGFRPSAGMDSNSGSVIRTGHNDVTVHNLTIDLGFMKFSIGGMLFGVPLLLGLFVHGVWLPLRLKRGAPKTTAFVRRLGLFVPPLHLGILVLAAATFFHFRKPWHHTDAREYKEMVVPMVYVFALLHCFFRRRTALATTVTAATLLIFCLAMAWLLQQGMPGEPYHK